MLKRLHKVLIIKVIFVFLMVSPSFAEGPSTTPPLNSDGGQTVEGTPDGATPPQGSTEFASCAPASIIPELVCDLGAGFLCVNTPPLSITGDNVIVKGTIDRSNNALAALNVYVQHDYTKTMSEVVLKEPLTSNCWETELTEASNYCLDPSGYFSVRIPISQMGPYSITLHATRLEGSSVESTIKTSRVIAPTIAKGDITLDPNPETTNGSISQPYVYIDIDLLHGCEFCDFLGTSTGGAMITVSNVVEGEGVVEITRKTNVAAGGKFRLCVPVSNGENHLKIFACNAATGYEVDSCPKVEDIDFNASVGANRIEIISPDTDNKLVYSASEYPAIPLQFKVHGVLNDVPPGPGGSCSSDVVTVEWDRYPPVNLCQRNGLYEARLIPETGVNIGVIRVKDNLKTIEHSFTLGWGDILSPFASGGIIKTDDQLLLNDAVAITLSEGFLTETFRGIVNDMLATDRITDLFKKFFGDGDKKKTNDDPVRAAQIREIRREIPFCAKTTGGGLSSQGMELVGDPLLNQAEVQSISLEQNKINATIDIRDLSLKLRLFKDADQDGLSDNGKFMPLKVAFEHLFIKPVISLEQTDKPLLLITSPYTECNFKNDRYCENKPALLIPQNTLGAATKGGGYAVCDSDDQMLSGDMEEGCDGVNILNMQTGLINGKIMDIINDKAYCDGSAALTYLLRKSISDFTIDVGCPTQGVLAGNSTSDTKISFFGCGEELPKWLEGRAWSIPAGINLGGGVFALDKNGATAYLPARVGSSALYGRMKSELKKPDVGILMEPNASKIAHHPGALKREYDLDAAISDRLINQVLFALTEQDPLGESKGLFDWDIDEPFINSLGFDFVKECDAFEPTPELQKPPALCRLRPQVGEILGATLTTEQYFLPKQPLRIKIRGNRELPPHVRLYTTTVPDMTAGTTEDGEAMQFRDADILEIQLADMEVSFYALKTDSSKSSDQYNNMPILFDEDGNVSIDSMNPLDPNPENGPIIRFKATILLALEMGGVFTDPDDTSSFRLTIRPNSYLSRVIPSSIEGANSTIVSDYNLMSAFKEKINYGINIYGEEENAIHIKLPKSINLEDFVSDINDRSSLLNLLGLGQLKFGRGGLYIGGDETNEFLRVALKLLTEKN